MEVTERSDGKTVFQCQVCGREACLLQRDSSSSPNSGGLMAKRLATETASDFHNGNRHQPTAANDAQLLTSNTNTTNNNNNDIDGMDSTAAAVTALAKVWLNFKIPLMCGACKKFYTRCKAKIKDNAPQECTCPVILQKARKAANATSQSTGMYLKQMCWYCRFQRCQMVMAERHSSSAAGDIKTADQISNNNGRMMDDENQQQLNVSLTVKRQQQDMINVRLIPCQVCGASSSGYHFGVISCEGCKGFFRRSLNGKHETYQCSRTLHDQFVATSAAAGNAAVDDEDLTDDAVHQSRCKLCRWKQCIAAGMSTDAVRTGRHSIQRKMETSVHMQNLAAENRLLQETVFRRDHRRRLIKRTWQSPAPGEQESGTTTMSQDGRYESPADDDLNYDLVDNNSNSSKTTNHTPSHNSSRNSANSAAATGDHCKIDTSRHKIGHADDYDSKNKAANLTRFLKKADDHDSHPIIVTATSLSNSSNLEEYGFSQSSPSEDITMLPSSSISTSPSSSSSASSTLIELNEQFCSAALSLLSPTSSSVFSSASSPLSDSTAAGVYRSTSPSNSFDNILVRNNNFSNVRFESNSSALLTKWATARPEKPLSYDLIVNNYSQVSGVDLAINGAVFSVNDAVLQSIVEATARLNDIRLSRCQPLAFEMNLAEVWTRIVKTSFEPHLKLVSMFVRSLPGFQKLKMLDRMRLFSNAYFPILLAVLSLDFDEFTGQVNYFCLPDFTSRRVFKSLFGCDHSDINERQFRDAGHSMVQWSPNFLEFGVLCGLLFFNPSVSGLEDVECVRQINGAYHLVDEQFNQRFDALHQRMQNFSVMGGYFEQMNQVFALGIENMRTSHPQLLALHPLFSEVHSLLASPPLPIEAPL